MIPVVIGKNTELSFYNNVLTFKSKVTTPAEIRISALDGRTLDIPFRGWIESDVSNKIALQLNHLKSGIYIITLRTNEGSINLKIQK